ncbi:hypothetical protein [Nodularia spumigena]|uniref:hypothetical protein n=1 Tax=Nodularia spumigena TaxID=70799 RepID=UPI00232CA794|nr:hypothetical protein [Nodularia spumigena]MDB9339953.1 hypothetical protein [Nodularia spumigena CS-589/07]MDB9360446.1 hypothetical protein [Nodularia spumigena CS-588/02]MDB9366001.1 hypothetical protein [Nodularia spumigena CS-588/02A10]MDB9400536.1 hypothetical protein [Microcystis aeruginosa CS-567/02-A1]MDB9530811.1 hypothetical protein [Nodularia spumigena CS-1038]
MEYSYFSDDSPHSGENFLLETEGHKGGRDARCWVLGELGYFTLPVAKQPFLFGDYSPMDVHICGAIAPALFDVIHLVYKIFIALCHLSCNTGKYTININCLPLAAAVIILLLKS